MDRRTEITYESITLGKKTAIFKAPSLYGRRERIHGGHKREVGCAYPGRSVDLPRATVGSLRGGRRVWLSAKLPEPMKVVGDDVEMYLVFTNSHDGSSAVKVCITPIRVVCENTLTWGLKAARRTWSLRHTQNMHGRLKEALQTLQMAEGYGRVFRNDANRLADKRVSLEKYLERLLPLPTIAEAGRRAIENQKNRREAIAYLYYNRADLRSLQGTAWGALQAVAEFVSHAKPTRETETYRKRRFEKLIDGHELLGEAHRLAVTI